MTTVNLIHRHIFGLKTGVSNNIFFVDEQTVVYPAGHNIIVYCLDEKRQKFIPGTENTDGITSMALAPNRRFIAVAEKSDRGLVSIYDFKTLKKRKVLSSADTQGLSYVYMEFSSDNQLLLTQGGPPDWILICWNWSKGKAIASVKSPLHVVSMSSIPAPGGQALASTSSFSSNMSPSLHSIPSNMNVHHQSNSNPVSKVGLLGLVGTGSSLNPTSENMSTNLGMVASNASGNGSNGMKQIPIVTQCSFSAVDPGLVCVTGVNLVRYFRMLENQSFRPMPSPKLQGTLLFTCHAWIKQRDDLMIAGTISGDIMLFQGGEFVTRLTNSPGEGRSIYSLLSTSKGVLCGLDDSLVYMYSLNPAITVNFSKKMQSNKAQNERHKSGLIEDTFATPITRKEILDDTNRNLDIGIDSKTETVYDDADSDSDDEGFILAELLVLQRQVKVDTAPSNVCTVCVSPNEDIIVVTTSSGQLLMFPYQHQLPLSINTISNTNSIQNVNIDLDSLTSSDAMTGTNTDIGKQASVTPLTKSDDVEHVLCSFHRPSETTGQMHITGMDVCVRKPILVTCGLDKTVRVWNYIERYCEVLKTFAEEAHSLSCHPSGLHLLVGFADKLRLMNILMDDIRPFKEVAVKSCRECQFSTGGQFFAAVNGNTIQVFSFFTGDLISNLRGHNGKVRCLYWNRDDSSLISAGMDGAVYVWDVDEAKRESEFVQKGVPYFSALCNREGTAVYAVGNDKMLKEIEFPACQLSKEFACDNILGQIVLSNSQRMLFGACAYPEKPGAVRSFKFPLTGESIEFQCLSLPVTRMRISFDDAFLFTAGEDGAICIMEIRDRDGRPRMLKEGRNGGAVSVAAVASNATATGSTTGAIGMLSSDFQYLNNFSDEVLVTKSDLEEKNTLMMELKNKVDELMLHNEYQLRLKDMTYSEQLKDLTEKFTHEIELEKNKLELLTEDKNDIEMEYEQKIKHMEEKHAQEMQEYEANYQHRIMKEVEKYQDVLHQREVQSQSWKDERTRLVSTHEKYVNEVSKNLEQRLKEDQQLRVQMEHEREELQREYHETIAQVEADIDEEIENMKQKYEEKLRGEREATLRFKGENGIMKKKFSALQKDIGDQRDEIKVLLEKEKALIDDIKALEKDIQQLKREIRTRDETIGDKEKRIYELKKKNQELEKFKFVLDYKIKELKRQIEPRENEIGEMKLQIQEMDRELELFHNSNAQLDLMIGEQRRRINTMQDEIIIHRKCVCDQQTWINRFRCDLYEAVQYIQNPMELTLKVALLYKKYVTNELVVNNIEPEIQQEYGRQKEYLENAVKALKTKYMKHTNVYHYDNMKAIEENMLLIKEIHELRQGLSAAKATLQMERATSTHRVNGAKQKAIKSQTQIDPDHILELQNKEIEDLNRQIKALEEKISTSQSQSHGLNFPPLRGVDG